MRDADFVRAFSLLEADVRDAEPEMAFADELYESLRAEVGRREPLPRHMVLAIAALLVVLLVSIGAVIGALLLRPDPAVELVRRSQALHANPPAFSVVTTSGPIEWELPPWYTACADPAFEEEWRQLRWRYEYDGSGSFQQACVYGGPPPMYVGGLEVATPDGHGIWDAAEWRLLEPGFLNRPPGAPLASLLWLTWLDADGSVVRCPDWELGGTDTIAGRPARAVICGSDRYWIEPDSGFLLRREREDEVVAEVLELTLGSVVRPITLFPEEFSTRLEMGEPAADVSLPIVDGGSWSSSSALGRRLAILIHWSCEEAVPCVTVAEFAAAVSARSDNLAGVVIRLDPDQTLTDAEREAASAAGVYILEDDQSGWPRWEYPHLGGLVLIDPEGRMVAAPETLTSATLTAALDAFVTGEAIPDPPPWDGYFAPGQRMPALTGERLGGGTYDSRDAVGRRLFVLVPPPFAPGEPSACPDGGLAEDSIRSVMELAGEDAVAIIAWGGPFGGPPLYGWDQLLVDLGLSDGELAVVAPDDSAYRSWGSLRGNDPACGPATPILVVADASGALVAIGNLDE